MGSLSLGQIIKKYSMVIALVVIIGVFTIGTGGKILFPQNINNLLSQNAYVFVLATGMLMCILTGGNIDLSVGSVVCFIGRGTRLQSSLLCSEGCSSQVVLVSSLLRAAYLIQSEVYPACIVLNIQHTETKPV